MAGTSMLNSRTQAWGTCRIAAQFKASRVTPHRCSQRIRPQNAHRPHATDGNVAAPGTVEDQILASTPSLDQIKRLELALPSLGSGDDPVEVPQAAPVPVVEQVDLTPLYGSLENRATRPFLPDITGAIESLMGGSNSLWTAPDARATVAALMGPEDGPPRVVKLIVPRPPGSAPPTELPIMFYLPGIDGTGLAAWRQFTKLAPKFDLRAFIIPPGDRTNFEGLVSIIQAAVEREVLGSDVRRPVYLLGESFGCLTCLAVGVRCRELVDRLVLVNPASSFQRTAWPVAGQLLPQMPIELYGALPFVLSPMLTNPFSIASNYVDRSRAPADQISDFAYGLVKLIPELADLRKALPPATLSFRLQLLEQGCKAVEPILTQVPQRVLVLAGERDMLIPSAEEAKRLGEKITSCTSRVVAGHSHAMLQETGIDLPALLEEEGFYVRERKFSSAGYIKARRQRIKAGSSAAIAPVLEVPTKREVRKLTDKLGMPNLRKAVSPVFLSTDAQGRIQQDLGAIPPPGPLLFVGNHSFMDLAMPLMIEEFLLQRDIFLRGMAHPMLASEDNTDRMAGSEQQAQQSRSFFRSWGAVPVGAKGLHTLLQQGEAVLLFPGGAAEALKRRRDTYKLLWPERSEFVRMAARHGATIIPFSVIGADEIATQLLDTDELAALPFVGDWYRQQMAQLPDSRVGVNVREGGEQSFGLPLAVPNPASPRFYHLFGKPITTAPSMARDKERCAEVYSEVRDQVEAGFSYLLRKREQDPYKDVVKRVLYEANWGWSRQAPTFPL